MKQDLIDAMQYPCRRILTQLSTQDCPFDFEYDERQRHCRECQHGQDCQWLGAHDKLRRVNALTTAELVDALHGARRAISAQVPAAHNRQACSCSDCSWLRQSRRLLLNIGEFRRA